MNYIEIEKYKRKYKVEIGIGVYNEINFIKNTLDSVIRNYKYIDHIILSDNASTDGTTEICKEYADKYDKIDLYCQKKQMPLFIHLKWIISQGNSKYFMFVRVKDILDDNYIEECVKALDSNSEAVVATTNLIGYSYDPVGDLSHLFYFSRLKNMNSYETLIRVNTVLRYHFETCQTLWCMSKFDVLKGGMEYINYKQLGSDVVLAMYMAIAGKWCQVEGVNYKRYWRLENASQVAERYKERHLSTEHDIHNLYYLPIRFWELLKENANELCTSEFRNMFSLQCAITYDAYWSDEEWIDRHTNQGINKFIQTRIKGRNVVFYGAGKEGQHVSAVLSQVYKTVAFVDNESENKFIGNIPVYKEDYLLNIDKGENIIIISSVLRRYDMMDWLLSNGFCHGKDFVIIPGEVNF